MSERKQALVELRDKVKAGDGSGWCGQRYELVQTVATGGTRPVYVTGVTGLEALIAKEDQ